MISPRQTVDPPVRFGPDGLIPAVIQDSSTEAVLMVAFMNDEALAATRDSGRVHFWSRSRRSLWRKGETSGHEQFVESIHVNCDQNSLLVRVRQIGAVCHDGYDTCFYRRLEADGQLTVTRERSFDPAQVYRAGAGPEDSLAARSQEHYHAFAYLRDHDLSAVSGTSALLHGTETRFHGRIADELRELAGVLDGTHRHAGVRADVLLEGGQVLYWITIAALHGNIRWNELRPDRALATRSDELQPATLAKMLSAEARHWETVAGAARQSNAAHLHATLGLIGQTLHVAGLTPFDLIDADLAALYAKPYIASYKPRLASLPTSAADTDA